MKLFLLIFFLIQFKTHAFDCPTDWKSDSNFNCTFVDYNVTVDYPISSLIKNYPNQKIITAKIRAGYIEENLNLPFKGNILYFEGLGDSMINHAPLFKKLANIGFRVIAFDYMGQGGSSGSMNDTRILDIPNLGMKIFNKFAKDLTNFPKPIIIGWSTGGLAAYLSAEKINVKKIILLAPGIVPNVIMGEHNIFKLDFDIITLNSLNSENYENGKYNPHLEGIKPRSPLNVPDFAYDLITKSFSARKKKINPEIDGIVFHSGEDDTYVDSLKNSYYINILAPHFTEFTFYNSLHEIDNEKKEISDVAHKKIIEFLSK